MRRHLLGVHQEFCDRLAQYQQKLLDGEAVTTEPLLQIISSLVQHLRNDTDLVLSVLSEVDGAPPLMDRAVKTAALTLAMGLEWNWPRATMTEAGLAALTHDFGMALLPPSATESAKPLSDNDLFEILKHPLTTRTLLDRIRGFPALARHVAGQVHERPDGSGYPSGRTLRQIHPIARTLGVADHYVALTNRRPDRPRLMAAAAIECLCHLARHHLVDRQAVRVAMIVLAQYPIGSFVRLATGQTAQVIRRNGTDYGRPVMRFVVTENGQSSSARALPSAAIDAPVPSPNREETPLTAAILSCYVRPPQIRVF